MSGTLYIIATPIGNLEDISARALRLLGEVDLIAAEDTRRTRKLLTHYNISSKLVSFHEHNERSQAARLMQQIGEGTDMALVTDAGTPTISDPGYHLIRLCRENDVPVQSIPGPSALITALAGSGLPSNSFYFAGFPPVKGGKKRRFLENLETMQATLIFYESPHRIAKTLGLMLEVFGDRSCVLAREMTKRHEEYLRGPLQQIAQEIESKPIKGEIVILLSGAQKPPRASKKKQYRPSDRSQ